MRTLFLFLLASLLLLSPPALANVSYELDLMQGFRHQAGSTRPVGYITSLQVGSTTLRPDLPIKNPVTQSTTAVVGVLSRFMWSGASGSQKQFSFNVSLQNKQVIQNLRGDPALAGRDVKITYVIYDYDTRPPARYFTALQPRTATLAARFLVEQGRVVFNVSPNVDPTVPSPLNFAAYLGLNPGRAEQYVLHTPVAGGPTGLKAWMHNGP